ncbi:tyrosinase [Streptomyces actuosus]|uniref:Tyrosinase n=1 Tax=Streptomyces actuosus TaxID=1885 RepID=A0ABS2VTF4_STRAS|nr:tyrosinase family oxidase copper chaperone [Streptomyces actuosus]MBN0046390.1 tyrosinase [Streptomyces actuosus]
MGFDVGASAVGTERTTAKSARSGSRGGTRREVLRGLLAPAFAVALAPVVAASRPPRPTDGGADGPFDETYRGRRIQGVPVPGARAVDPDRWRVTVDGHPLHLMRRADGSWLSVVDHYGSYPTPLAAARAAVDALGPHQQLREHGIGHGTAPATGHGRHHHTGGEYDVHA